ncbi:MAG: hypothetical protein ACEQSX_08030 [Baekduiaceae bacterium]
MSSDDRAARRRADREAEQATRRKAERAGLVVPGSEDPNLTLDQRALRDKLGIPSEAQDTDTPRPIQIGATATPGGDDLDLANAGKMADGGKYSAADFEELRQAALILMSQMDEERRDTITVTAGLVMAAGGKITVSDELMETVGEQTQLMRWRDDDKGTVVWEVVRPVGDCGICSAAGTLDGETPCYECQGLGITYEAWTPPCANCGGEGMVGTLTVGDAEDAAPTPIPCPDCSA